MTSQKHSFVPVAALLALAATQACGGGDGSSAGTMSATGGGSSVAGATSVTSAGTGGAAAGGMGVAVGGTGGMGVAVGGTGGMSVAVGGTGGAVGGTGGAAGGTGGAAGGTGGAVGGTGGASPTFAAVKALFGTSCGVGKCHNQASGQLDYQGTTDLHALLTTPIAGAPHCSGSTLAVPNDTSSLLLRITMGSTQCLENGAMKSIDQMPDNCAQGNKCLSSAQMQVLSDWIAAGAPQ